MHLIKTRQSSTDLDPSNLPYLGAKLLTRDNSDSPDRKYNYYTDKIAQKDRRHFINLLRKEKFDFLEL